MLVKESVVDQVNLHMFRSHELAKPRHHDTKRLTRYGRKVYSQNDEDGIIAEIFHRIGVENCTFVEFGVGSGVECNSLWLLTQGWSGLWIEGNADYTKSIEVTHKHWRDNNKLIIKNNFVTKGNINSIIAEQFHEKNLDLLSIDIDFNDFWIWKEIFCVNPRVVVIEYNASWPPPVSITVPYDGKAQWSRGNYFGASLEALNRLGQSKGYSLIGCSLSGVNAFFVRNDLLGDHFIQPGSSFEHYEPARYFLSELQAGHPPFVGPLFEVE